MSLTPWIPYPAFCQHSFAFFGRNSITIVTNFGWNFLGWWCWRGNFHSQIKFWIELLFFRLFSCWNVSQNLLPLNFQFFFFKETSWNQRWRKFFFNFSTISYDMARSLLALNCSLISFSLCLCVGGGEGNIFTPPAKLWGDLPAVKSHTQSMSHINHSTLPLERNMLVQQYYFCHAIAKLLEPWYKTNNVVKSCIFII